MRFLGATLVHFQAFLVASLVDAGNAAGCGACPGNYSDGNLVATLLSHYLNVTQCTIAHALEKTKYEDADVYWWGPALHALIPEP